jgi:mRNA interferase YafO
VKARVFHHRSLDEHCQALGVDLSALKKDFRQYKESGIPPGNFGRDAQYNHPNALPIVRQEKVAHIHLEEPDTPWRVKTVQFNRTSDTHLIYCRGFSDENCYLLMALLSPNAHDQAWNNTIMYNLGKMAEQFRNQY